MRIGPRCRLPRGGPPKRGRSGVSRQADQDGGGAAPAGEGRPAPVAQVSGSRRSRILAASAARRAGAIPSPRTGEAPIALAALGSQAGQRRAGRSTDRPGLEPSIPTLSRGAQHSGGDCNLRRGERSLMGRGPHWQDCVAGCNAAGRAADLTPRPACALPPPKAGMDGRASSRVAHPPHYQGSRSWRLSVSAARRAAAPRPRFHAPRDGIVIRPHTDSRAGRSCRSELGRRCEAILRSRASARRGHRRDRRLRRLLAGARPRRASSRARVRRPPASCRTRRWIPSCRCSAVDPVGRSAHDDATARPMCLFQRQRGAVGRKSALANGDAAAVSA
jgi:hypothetical protein